MRAGHPRLKTWVTEWEERRQKVMKIAGITGRGVAHRLRDSFSVDLLNNGVPIRWWPRRSAIRLRSSKNTIRRGPSPGRNHLAPP